MARGRLLRTKTKEAYQISKRAEAGKIQAQVEAQRKKPLDVSMKEHIGTFLDKLGGDDALLLGLGAYGYLKSHKLEDAVFLMVSYKLALSPSITTSTAGLVGLAGWGLCSAFGVDVIAGATSIAETVKTKVAQVTSPEAQSDFEMWLDALLGKAKWTKYVQR